MRARARDDSTAAGTHEVRHAAEHAGLAGRATVVDSKAPFAFTYGLFRPHVAEHIRSADPRFARKQRRINLVWLLLAGGCNLDRDPERAIEDAGFIIERARHFDFLVNGRTTPQLSVRHRRRAQAGELRS